ncbi:MAG: response regulator transcription factor [Chloroflexaceae bacterium]
MTPPVSILISSLGERTHDYLVPRLMQEGYQASLAIGLQQTLEMLRRRTDLLLLDLPSADEVIHIPTIRAACSATLIIIGPARNDRLVVSALELGADDYVQRPLRTEELLARIRAQLRRRIGQSGALVYGLLSLDPQGHWATHAGKPVELRPEAFTLLSLLGTRPGHPYPSAGLARRLWRSDDPASLARLADLVEYLRTLIEVDPRTPLILCGDIAQGYWLTHMAQTRNAD